MSEPFGAGLATNFVIMMRVVSGEILELLQGEFSGSFFGKAGVVVWEAGVRGGRAPFGREKPIVGAVGAV